VAVLSQEIEEEQKNDTAGTMVNDNDDSDDENLDGQVIDLDSESDEETP
jgi:hypothetical protein|tara:strand:- start:839 stop:985 length:147 start_codon:yes stop_codon:yes gene_type:complete